VVIDTPGLRPVPDAGPLADADIRLLSRRLSDYRTPNRTRSIAEIAITLAPLVLLWLLTWAAWRIGPFWLYAALTVPAAGFLLRLFMIQHDCGHGSFFTGRRANDWTGRVLGVLTLTPYDHWRHDHACHHATHGNLDRRGMGDVDTMTVAEYLASSRLRRLRYRLYRHPLVMFGLGPAYLFLLRNRIPIGSMRKGWREWVSPMLTNVAIALAAGLLIWSIGAVAFVAVHGPLVLMAATAGVWLFYVQHQFEETHWESDATWDVREAALHGSSHYDLPAILRWFTANIGMHHLHHLSSRIPYYRLPEVLRDHPALRHVGRLTLLRSFGCTRLVLWDEARRRLISFRELRRGLARA
jgi:omega-6 fatty acid desaturase (delta-12 desaturase)